jgi:hypothetical protein
VSVGVFWSTFCTQTVELGLQIVDGQRFANIQWIGDINRRIRIEVGQQVVRPHEILVPSVEVTGSDRPTAVGS